MIDISLVLDSPCTRYLFEQALASSLPAARTRFYDRADLALSSLKNNRGDFAILDQEMRDADGLDYIPEIIDGSLAIRIMIVGRRLCERTLVVLGRLGCKNWIDLKTITFPELQLALVSFSKGQAFTSPSIKVALTNLAKSEYTTCRLTPREELIFAVLAEGLDDEEAAPALGLKPSTVRTHRMRIMRKLGIHHRDQLPTYAHRRGYLRVMTDGRIVRPGFETQLRQMSGCNRSRPLRNDQGGSEILESDERASQSMQQTSKSRKPRLDLSGAAEESTRHILAGFCGLPNEWRRRGSATD